MADAAAGKLSREDFKRQKAIEEQRKAGTLPAEVDPETGRDINPHIPQYISKAPWYLDIQHATLKHQRPQKEEDPSVALNEWYERGKTAGQAKKYRKGACENCGAMTHKTRDCMDRPRKLGAKHTNKNIAPDEVITNLQFGYDAKRDRWNGYDPNDHSKVIEDWELVEQKRKQNREHEAQRNLTEAAEGKVKPQGPEKEGGGFDDDDDDDDQKDEDKYADSAEAVGQKLDAKTRTTVRNLRIREDTAKYLLNLDVNSAYYDPKTRSMRDNPLANKDPKDLAYAGDNFVRWSGEAPKMLQLQKFAWEAAERGNVDVSLQANPTQGEKLFKEHQQKKTKVSESLKGSILDKYGGEEHLQAPPKELLLAQTEAYVEYSQTGKVIKGQEKATIRSKYEEDVFPLNHKSVWGSYWNAGRWGYACCHSFVQGSYCTGEAGKQAALGSARMLQEATSSKPAKTLLETHLIKAGKELAAGGNLDDSMAKKKVRGERLGEGDVTIDKDKLKAALELEEKRKKGLLIEEEEIGKKRKYNSLETTTEVTEEELEAYRMKKSAFEDPMANYRDGESEHV